jgi:hypothetical protein
MHRPRARIFADYIQMRRRREPTRTTRLYLHVISPRSESASACMPDPLRRYAGDQAQRYTDGFPDDAALCGGVLGEIYGPSNSETRKLTCQEPKELHAVTEAFTEELPDKTHLRSARSGLRRG